MNTIDVTTWEELETKLDEIATGEDFLFRGHSDAQWSLVTTLDRRLARPIKAMEYFRLALSAKTQVETLTGKTWEMPEHAELRRWSTEYDNKLKFPYQIPGYSFLVYLRHHGFPSPLLDWTRSRYIAAHFALAKTNAERAAIFVYKEYGAGGKVTTSSEPQIVSCGPYVRSHARHFLQQSQYTYCGFFDDDWHFVPHEDVFDGNFDLVYDQDYLWKITLPTTERVKVLKRLDAHNLNAFSLFQSDEALLETIALREIDF